MAALTHFRSVRTSFALTYAPQLWITLWIVLACACACRRISFRFNEVQDCEQSVIQFQSMQARFFVCASRNNRLTSDRREPNLGSSLRSAARVFVGATLQWPIDTRAAHSSEIEELLEEGSQIWQGGSDHRRSERTRRVTCF
jgi:hypothetical protein